MMTMRDLLVAAATAALSGSRRGDGREAASRGTSRRGCSADFLLVFGGVCGVRGALA